MYNRYIPQADGTYQKQKLPDNPSGRTVPGDFPIPSPPAPPPPKPPQPPMRVSSFFQQLLPADFDTEDLIVILLLLLMSERSREGPNTALLTMVMYLSL